MNRYRASFIERRRAAASITWPEGTLILTNPDPSAQRTLKGAAVALAAAACLFSITGTNGPLQSWARSREYLDMRPAIEAALKGGNRSAGTWLAVHFNRDYPGLLQAESDAGEPTAMYLVARMHLQKHAGFGHTTAATDTDQESGMQLMRRAAAAGSQDALRFLVSGHAN
ncbi:hypothetical protein E2P84_43910 [Burkholderia cepacia]|jgi:hypothetical protein|uniref:Sel1 repeat family protein n=1 Tax=Burkholderia cepacia TaxID=292 RepID=A0AAX2RLZ0_BURCE|nr:MULTISPECIES: hypothetical protein [Burkholderia]HDR9056880.1 hypothetical protein [Burkholderia vietnamiensis]ABK13551.1 hypothetical protein Bcen2424_6822 [Burkholderia cenocepacia HI2424]MCF1371756.1 hypothetical protein [Burkholderia cenocepacia]MCF1389135.1 hypothetical protein [Burkholderia cenocepacia]MCG0577187.1 hypothetical protein [Burkholderia cenocepacia]